MGAHMGELSESFQMNTNITGFKWFSKIIRVLWTKVASALEGLIQNVWNIHGINLSLCQSDDTFENNSGSNHKLEKYLKGSC